MKTRILHTKFYQDSYILTLLAKERFLFLYLITNERVEKTGAYEVPLLIIQLETGLTENEILKGIEKFQSSDKIYYVDNYIVIKNILKYQNYSKGSAKQIESFNKEYESLPNSVKAIIDNDTELVNNQLPTSYKLVINNKEEIINNKTRIIKKKKVEDFETPNPEDVNLKNIINYYNEVFNKNIVSDKGFIDNYRDWVKVHDVNKIRMAILNARKDSFWKDKLTLSILFRKKNQRNEAVDYIEELSSKGTETKSFAQKGDSKELEKYVSPRELTEFEQFSLDYMDKKFGGRSGWNMVQKVSMLEEIKEAYSKK